jgi:hypothetical protein
MSGLVAGDQREDAADQENAGRAVMTASVLGDTRFFDPIRHDMLGVGMGPAVRQEGVQSGRVIGRDRWQAPEVIGHFPFANPRRS